MINTCDTCKHKHDNRYHDYYCKNCYQNEKLADDYREQCNNRWERKETITMPDEITIDDVKQKIVEKMYKIVTDPEVQSYCELKELADVYYTLNENQENL